MSTPQEPPRPTPVAADRPVVDKRDPDELRADIEATREELGETVEELAHRVDVPARVRERRDETVARVQQTVAHTTDTVQQRVAQTTATVQQQAARAHETLAEKAPVVDRTVRERPAAVLGVLAAIVAFLLVRAHRRRPAGRPAVSRRCDPRWSAATPGTTSRRARKAEDAVGG